MEFHQKYQKMNDIQAGKNRHCVYDKNQLNQVGTINLFWATPQFDGFRFPVFSFQPKK